MPKLYEYLGLIIFFYSNEHEPIHVHARYQDRESKIEIILKNGKLETLLVKGVLGKRPLAKKQLNDFLALVDKYHAEIIQSWIDYFVLHKRVISKTINERL